MENNCQCKCSSIPENDKSLDCRFLVGFEDETRVLIEANKLSLSKASEVFERMFFGSLPENTDQSIVIGDMEAEEFKNLLKYIDTQQINFKSNEEARKLYYAANKYLMNHLKDLCLKFISNTISEDPCAVYEFATFFEESHIKEKSLKEIQNHACAILKTEGFYQASLETVETIFSQYYLHMTSELDLWNALRKYAEHHLRIDISMREYPLEADESKSYQQQYAEDISTLRKIFKHIRFLTLTPDEFKTGPGFSNLLTEAESLKILKCIKNILPISGYPSGFCQSTEKRFFDCRDEYYLPRGCTCDNQGFHKEVSYYVCRYGPSKVPIRKYKICSHGRRVKEVPISQIETMFKKL